MNGYIVTNSFPVLGRLFVLALDALHGGTVWVRDKAEGYLTLLRSGLPRIVVLFLVPVGFFAIGTVLQTPWLLSLSMLLFGLLTVFLMIIAAPILTGIAASARAFPAFRIVVSAIGAAALFFLLTALAFQFIPINSATAVIVPTCAAILGFIWFFTGNKQSLTLITGKVMSVMVVAIIGPMLHNLFPETAGRLSALGGSFDRATARTLSSVGVKADSTSRIEIRSLAEFREMRFFHPQKRNESLVWYYKGPDGEIELFSAPGFHPLTGEELKPVTPGIVREIWKKLEREEKVRTSEAANAPLSSRIAPQSQPEMAPSPAPPRQAAAVHQQPYSVAGAVAMEAQRKRQKQQAMATAFEAYRQERQEIESEYQRAQNEARRFSESARASLAQRRQSEYAAAQSRCQLAQTALGQVPGLGAVGQSSCRQEQSAIDARYQQGLADVRANYEATLSEAQGKRAMRQDGAATRLASARSRIEGEDSSGR